MKERAQLIEWLRGELVGPSRPVTEQVIIQFNERSFADPSSMRRGPLAWLPTADSIPQEVLYFERESPHRKYGTGILHPVSPPDTGEAPAAVALEAADRLGIDPSDEDAESADDDDDNGESGAADVDLESSTPDDSDDFEVTSVDVRHPSTMGVSFCAYLPRDGELVVRIPQERRFSWQAEDSVSCYLNGRYESCERHWMDAEAHVRKSPMWRRLPAVLPDCSVTIQASEFASRRVVRREVAMPAGSPLTLRLEVFPRQIQGRQDAWLITVVLRNSTTSVETREREAVLYQALFEVVVNGGHFELYPESRRPFESLDADEQSLALLYADSGTWAIGHSCAGGWDAEFGHPPKVIYADAMPAVELPSMTPDIDVDGQQIRLSMRDMASLPDSGHGPAWDALESLAAGYGKWIGKRRVSVRDFPSHLAVVADRHLKACDECLGRIQAGIELLRADAGVRTAFRLSNLTMLLQQIATKQLRRRQLTWDATLQQVLPEGDHCSPWTIYDAKAEDTARIGSWRAFQIAFLVMSLDGVRDERSKDREVVDLIWFPTGGGKTEAYLALMAFYMFHERLKMNSGNALPRDGTNVLMRYTLRMLTTQQFQRAGSLISAMEYVRRNHLRFSIDPIPGARFSLGLWIGGDGSPNKIKDARIQIAEFRRGDQEGNPLVLTECPWCRAEIGRYKGPKPAAIRKAKWNELAMRGIIVNDEREGPRLVCPDSRCEFGREDPDFWLPVEVIDERIYANPPSLVIATVDKFAIVAYRPDAGTLFGRSIVNGEVRQVSVPPGLIIQDELHLISGPLGSMYALYEGVFERLCSLWTDGDWVKPKIIASTATIRGADDQVKTLYARGRTRFFPSPGLTMGDSFFGRYARDANNRLAHGRLYLGIHASDYGSVLTTQVRTFSSALFRPWLFSPERRDPWWTLLAFYNSIRELGGAKTLFDSDIRSRLKFLFNRENVAQDDRRTLRIVEELTSRLSQADIVRMMDRLASPYSAQDHKDTLDACLASNIIEVGVDIDRLSIMGVVGQPKTTSTYIQVTGRVGRRWWERPGLILAIYNPSKSRDRSHFEQFHSYHRRLYERVEPTTATPFAISAIQRGLSGALLVWARQRSRAVVQNYTAYRGHLDAGFDILSRRCGAVQMPIDQVRSIAEMERVRDLLFWKWQQNPVAWEEFPPRVSGEYLMLWPGQFATRLQKQHGAVVPSSMRQVDRTAELIITDGYAAAVAEAAVAQLSGINQPPGSH